MTSQIHNGLNQNKIEKCMLTIKQISETGVRGLSWTQWPITLKFTEDKFMQISFLFPYKTINEINEQWKNHT